MPRRPGKRRHHVKTAKHIVKILSAHESIITLIFLEINGRILAVLLSTGASASIYPYLRME